MRKTFLVLMATLACALSYAQKIHNVEVEISTSLQQNNEVPYSSQRITWNDFQGTPDHDCNFAAMTYSGIKMKYEYKTRNGMTTAKVILYPYMDQTQSWFKKEGRTDHILEHEQRHFDITALIANELAEEVKNRRFTLSTFASEMNKLHGQYMNKLKMMQQQYDVDTEHGIVEEKQSVWNERISAEVQRLFLNGRI